MNTDIITSGEIKYTASRTPVGSIARCPEFQSEESPTKVPVAVINGSRHNPLSLTWIAKRIDELKVMDDVICASFTKNVIIKTLGNESEEILELLTAAGLYVETAGEGPCDGPYFLEGRELYKAYRLYGDEYNAFVSGVVQSEEEPFNFMQLQIEKYVPVPSRCYFSQPSKEKPLSGKRVAIKDIYDIRGVSTAAGCKGYAAHHGPANDTAECIKSLLDQGAVIIGKVKTVQFASGMASADWVAQVCPTNPRGDEQLDTDCSSSGSAAAMAGYEWLDFAVGSDSLGSMTGPAAACGVFGLRPSIGALSNVGAVPVSSHLDTPGHFSRSIGSLLGVAEAWLKPVNTGPQSATFHPKPTGILVPQESQLSFVDSKISGLEGFVHELESYCGVTHTSFSVNDVWEKYAERPEGGPSLSEYIHSVVAHIQLHDCWQNASRFLESYSKEKLGKLDIDPLILYKWELGKKVTADEYETALERKNVFKKFLEKELFTEDKIMVLPGGGPDIWYRDEKTPEDRYDMWQGFGFQNTTYSVLGGLPAVNIPIGQRPYRSKATGEIVNQPVNIMVLGPRESDMWLMQQIDKVLGEDRRNVRIGSDTF